MTIVSIVGIINDELITNLLFSRNYQDHVYDLEVILLVHTDSVGKIKLAIIVIMIKCKYLII